MVYSKVPVVDWKVPVWPDVATREDRRARAGWAGIAGTARGHRPARAALRAARGRPTAAGTPGWVTERRPHRGWAPISTSWEVWRHFPRSRAPASAPASPSARSAGPHWVSAFDWRRSRWWAMERRPHRCVAPLSSLAPCPTEPHTREYFPWHRVLEVEVRARASRRGLVVHRKDACGCVEEV